MYLTHVAIISPNLSQIKSSHRKSRFSSAMLFIFGLNTGGCLIAYDSQLIPNSQNRFSPYHTCQQAALRQTKYVQNQRQTSYNNNQTKRKHT